jgi:hypothetical protein
MKAPMETMADSKRPNVLKVIHALEKEGESPPERLDEQALDPQLALLRAWQAERLSRTYADYLADERFRPACVFFLSDIYAPRDFSQRDRDFDHLHELLSRFLPEKMLRLLSQAISLNQMTYDLDHRMLYILVSELGMTDSLSPEVYLEAYQRCNNPAERLEQIEMMVAIVREVGIGARLPLVGSVLRLARRPALRWGWVDLYDFLERGYQAFQPIRDINPFVRVIEQREKRILEQIFSSKADPFQVV